MNTGKTVLKENGMLPACLQRQHLCGYACCKFTAGNWIMLLPNEYQQAQQHQLKMQHLSINDNHDQAVCHQPCRAGDLKPMDCSWYPLFPANESATQFLVADHRKCPIPNRQLIGKMLEVHQSALAWEQQYPGSLAHIVQLSRDFVGYLAFPYKIEQGVVFDMNAEEMQAISLAKQLPDDYRCPDWTIDNTGYTNNSTPDD